MIGWFTDPYPDELLYSACARFHERTQYSNKKFTLLRLFGTTNSTAIIDFPCRLRSFIAALPPCHSYSDDKLINEQTLLPFFSAFLPCERVSQLREDMKGNGGLTIHRRLGVMASRITTPIWLRFCPLCREADRSHYGETYWHRLHQLSGVLVCPIHNVFLENSHARRNSARDILRFVAADDALPAQYLDPSDSTHRILLMLARDAAWLFEHPNEIRPQCFI